MAASSFVPFRANSVLRHYGDDDSNNKSYVIGSLETIKKAMNVKSLNEMLKCIKNMRIYSSTVEKDIRNYDDIIYLNNVNIKYDELMGRYQSTNLIQIGKQRLKDDRYVLLNDVIKQQKETERQLYQQQRLQQKNIRKSSGASRLITYAHDTFPQTQQKQNDEVLYIKRVIAAQPSALQAIYLEALVDPHWWEKDQILLNSSPINEQLSSSERQRLNDILSRFE
ncbi:unnamed protein product [Didymodactylos carnosus]|uniref:Uncharacterized protein n=1 Tax=Didymodactylos carnosus TaxID=1234261 RepID=A0A8S2QFL8_9BILA|nr:unnamed protein product [Didymodactylos carnosus]CAF4108097.1 unnamed protein product [Didymodactylos carnosus]